MIQLPAFTKMEEFQLYQLLISDLRYQNNRKVLAYGKTKANCKFIRHVQLESFPFKVKFPKYNG